jgi:putative tryptophan/tyrosine transport system substrate-binding protein
VNRRALLASLAAASMLGTRSALAAPVPAKYRLGAIYAGWSELALGVKEREEAKKEREVFLKSLAALGYVEGRNLVVDWRFFDMDFSRAPQMAMELVRLRPDALLTTGTPQTKVLHDATKIIPIVTSVGDPVAGGFTESLGRPRGNITGLSQTHPDTSAKQIELIRRLVPKLDRLVLIGDVRYTGASQLLRPVEIAARASGLVAQVQIVDPTEFDHVFSEMRRSGARAAFIQFADGDAAIVSTKLAVRHGIATMYGDDVYVPRGGLMSFNMYHTDMLQRTASIIDKIFRGMKPADIPWELPDHSHLAINLGTAKLLGLTVPADLLLRADQVVE